MVVILVGLGFLRDSYLEYFMVEFASEASKASLKYVCTMLYTKHSSLLSLKMRLFGAIFKQCDSTFPQQAF